MKIKSQDILVLREKTQLSITTIKKALIEAGGDIEKAQDILQVKDRVRLEKMGTRTAREGRIYSYVHNNGKLAVLVEINCETDFAANTKEFNAFCERVAIQIAGMDPKCISRADVPEEEIEKRVQNIIYDPSVNIDSREEIINKALDSWYPEICLLEQPCIQPPTNKTIDQCRAEIASKLGENVVIKRFVRWEV